MPRTEFGRWRKFTDEEIDYIVARYAEGASLRDVAKVLRATPKGVKMALLRAGGQTRDQVEALRLYWRKR